MMVDPTTEHWLELKIVCDTEAVEAVAELYARYGFNQGVAIEEAPPHDGNGGNFAVAPGKLVTARTVLSPGDVPPEELEDTRRMLWVLRQQLWVLGRSRAVGALEIVERQEEDWPNAWKADYSIHRVGNRVLVKAPWHDYAPQPDETVIELDPGTAFGTGRHPSTQLCMEALEEEIKAGDHVLDVGIGAGVLATAAAVLGASRVDGVDIDPVAIRSARANAERNGVGGIVRVALGSIGPDGPFPGPFDLVIANILAEPLIGLAPRLAGVVAPRGVVVLSGILQSQAAAVLAAYGAAGFARVQADRLNGWVILTLIRRALHPATGDRVAPRGDA